MSTDTTSQQEATAKSTQTFITAFVLNAAIAGAQFAAWIIIRRYFPRIFQPRSELPSEGKRSRPLPTGLFAVIPAILRANDEDIINANGLDAYLFVRFLKLMTYLFGGIGLVTWIILLPIYGTSTTGNEGLNRFTFGNVGRDQQKRLIAPLIICWVSTFFILYMLKREYGKYVEKRQDFLTSRGWATKPQARTVLLTGIPDDYCNIEALESLTSYLPGGVRKVWLARDVKGLDKIYDRHLKATKKLEGAENKVIKLATKLVKKNKVPAEGNPDQEKNNSVLSRYVADKKRPTMKAGGKIPFVTGKKVDTIEWATEEIETTGKELAEKRANIHQFRPKSSAFILFNDQIAAHMFAQCLAHELPLRMSGRYINVSPDDVIWSTLDINPYSQKVRFVISWAATCAIIIFWSIPTAFVTSISNVSNLCTTVSWLSWLCSLPTPINGIIQGILPPVALMVLFLLLPPFFRFCAVFEGTPLRSMVEHSLQRRYFAFLFVQGFIVATLASGIMAGISQITNNPSSTVSLLAENLPKASIFFLTLIVTNGLSGAAGGVLQIAKLVIYYVKIVLLGGSPRAIYNIRFNMPNVRFGQTFPAQLLLVVIALAYSTIAPLICGFAFLTFGLWWFCYKYLFLWVFDQPAAGETGGQFFKTAINQLFVGLYIEHLCLIGLFFLARNTDGTVSAVPEAALMIVLLIITILFHIVLKSGYSPLAHYLPLSMAAEMNRNEERFAREMADEKRRNRPLGDSGNGSEKRQNSQQARMNAGFGGGSDSDAGHGAQMMNGRSNDIEMQQGQGLYPAQHDGGRSASSFNSSPEQPSEARLQLQHSHSPHQQNGGGDEEEDGGEFDELEGGLNEHAFHHPALYKRQPTIWLPRDRLGISQEAVRNARSRGIDMTDEDASIDEKGKLEIHRDSLPGTEFPQ